MEHEEHESSGHPGGGRFPNLAARREQRMQDQLRALELRKAGLSYRAIGEALGIGEMKAQALVHSGFRRVRSDNAREAVELEVQRLDSLYHVAYRDALSGNLKAIDRCLAISQRRAALLGLDRQAENDALRPHIGVMIVGGSKDDYVSQLRALAERPTTEALQETSVSDEDEIIVEEEE